jgi:hypothetical protein
MKCKALAIALVTLAVCSRAEDAPVSAARRDRLKHLGGAIKAYGILHENKPPAKLSDLYHDGLADKLTDFVCPGSGTTITSEAEIDAKSDYTVEPLADAKEMIVREKNPLPGANTVLAIFTDSSIKSLPVSAGSTAATTPATSSPSPAAKTSPSVVPSATADSGLVVVPNLALFDTVSKMKAELERLGLVGNFSAKGKPPTKALEFKFASQLPLADTKVKPGTKVEVFIYQKFEEATTAGTTIPSTAASATPAPQGDEVVVPNLAQFDSVSKMKAALDGVGLKGHFSAKGKPPTKAMEFKFASQTPAANTKAKRGSMVVVFIYQKFEDTAQGSPSPSAPASAGTVSDAMLGEWEGTVGQMKTWITISRQGNDYSVWILGETQKARIEEGRLVGERTMEGRLHVKWFLSASGGNLNLEMHTSPPNVAAHWGPLERATFHRK